jgi:hypothetical protein
VLGKKLRDKAFITKKEPLTELDEEDEITLFDNSHIQAESSTQRRSSGRLSKRSRQDDDFVYEKL